MTEGFGWAMRRVEGGGAKVAYKRGGKRDEDVVGCGGAMVGVVEGRVRIFFSFFLFFK